MIRVLAPLCAAVAAVGAYNLIIGVFGTAASLAALALFWTVAVTLAARTHAGGEG